MADSNIATRERKAAVSALAPDVPVGAKDAILRAANSPNIDPERLERFLAMYERLEAREAEAAYNAAMSAAQAEMRPIAADANNPSTKSRYASYAALDRALRPIYTAHGFGLSFETADGAPPDHVRVVANVTHSDGHSRSPHIDMPTDGKGPKGGDVMTRTHATGAAMTYGQRYLLKAIFSIAVGDDDDGNYASIRDRSPTFERAVTEVNACADLAALKAWKAERAALEKLLPTAEWNELVRLVNRRVLALKDDTR